MVAPLFQAFGLFLLPAPRCASVRWCEGIRDLRWACPESTWGNGIAAMRCRRGAGIFASGGCKPSASFSLPLGEMLRFLSLLGCTKIVQTKGGSVETIENIEPKFGGASRARTDDLIVANDALSQLSYSPTGRMDCSWLRHFTSVF